MKPGVAARAEAARLLGSVVRGGAWSNVLLSRLDLPPDDARLVRYLVYGSLRNLGRLDRAVGGLSSRPAAAVDEELLDVLRIAFHEVLFGRTPDHAVADTAVEAARALGYGRAAGFVNALVRRLQKQGEPSPPAGAAEAFSLPEWVVNDLASVWGEGPALAFAEASHRDAPPAFRMQGGRPPPPGALPAVVPGAFTHPEGPPPEGAVVQDPSSLAAVLALEAAAGERVLEVGAAPGGKSMALWDMGPPGLLAALDIHEGRIRRAVRRTAAAGFGGRWVRADGARLPFRPASFDRVLVDAPCTGLGTLRRRPEIRFRVTPDERDRLAALQRRLLEEALTAVRPGGRAVYAVCTVTQAETVGAVEGLGGRPPQGLPGLRLDSGLLMGPHLTNTDGMFISVLDR